MINELSYQLKHVYTTTRETLLYDEKFSLIIG